MIFGTLFLKCMHMYAYVSIYTHTNTHTFTQDIVADLSLSAFFFLIFFHIPRASSQGFSFFSSKRDPVRPMQILS